MTDAALAKELRDTDAWTCNESYLQDLLNKAAEALEKLEADNAALREHIADIHNRVRHELYADIEAAQCKAFKAMSGSKVLRDAALLAGKEKIEK